MTLDGSNRIAQIAPTLRYLLFVLRNGYCMQIDVAVVGGIVFCISAVQLMTAAFLAKHRLQTSAEVASWRQWQDQKVAAASIRLIAGATAALH